ncbi:MAG: response regulator [Deltaproteobacteria bacterium HGW-Deltaproteobacteria-21]|jgi:CheY-like chemotaxis protein|nr:MAG: response regulator [Deltaproteobacteria bacterium HGW-Deltaproteobacteria-21]
MSKKILIVDDDPDVVSYLDSTFKDAGYATCFAYDGEEALRKVKTENPDLVTLDMDMPVKGGTMFFVGMRREKDAKEIPVIVISGVGPRPPSLRADIPTVIKPIDREKLLSLVAERLPA